ESAFGYGTAADCEGELLHRLGNKPVERPRPAPARDLDQPGLLQDAQMVRHRRLREAKRFGELARADLTLTRDSIDDRHSRRVRERFEPLGQRPGGAFCKGRSPWCAARL